MPNLPPKPCSKPGCHRIATKRSRCDQHQPQAWQDKGSGSSRGYGWQWQRLKSRIMARDGHLCQQCRRDGRLTTATAVDHIVPKSQGGTDEVSNLEAICKRCHDIKTKAEAAAGRCARERQ